jgi:hypothetical protein
MGPFANPPRRSGDPDERDFRAARVPRYWKTLIYSVVTLGVFVASVLMTLRGGGGGKDVGSSGAVVESLARVEGKVEDAVSRVAGVAEQNEDMREQVREIRRIVDGLRKNGTTRERAEDRHAEVMALLNEFKERGIKRK